VDGLRGLARRPCRACGRPGAQRRVSRAPQGREPPTVPRRSRDHQVVGRGFQEDLKLWVMRLWSSAMTSLISRSRRRPVRQPCRKQEAAGACFPPKARRPAATGALDSRHADALRDLRCPAAVVPHGDPDPASVQGKIDVDLRGVSMPDGVGNPLLDDAVDRGVDVLREDQACCCSGSRRDVRVLESPRRRSTEETRDSGCPAASAAPAVRRAYPQALSAPARSLGHELRILSHPCARSSSLPSW